MSKNTGDPLGAKCENSKLQRQKTQCDNPLVVCSLVDHVNQLLCIGNFNGRYGLLRSLEKFFFQPGANEL